ncbi:hypothetical protein ACLOJK_026380 [Asimina triloba]
MSDSRVSTMKPPLVPLATLIGRELRSEKIEKPLVKYGHAALAKKGEDYFLIKPDCQRIPGNSATSFSVFAIFDGHNGVAAAVFSKENLLNHVMSAVPQGIDREEWLQVLPRALVAGETSGTTVTFVVVDGLTVTVASVGDSRCILDTQGGVVSLLTVDHRLEENAEERERVTASGGEVGRLNVCGGTEVGPLRCWPGGLCLSRSIGDTDVGEFIVPIPHVKQVKLSNAGGRLIIASDGIWDALSSEIAAQSCRGLPAELAAKMVVKEALRSRGLKDDTTCIVVDIIPPDNSVAPSSPKKKQNMLSSLIFRKRFNNSVNKPSNKLSSVGAVEELFEEGSAMLAESSSIASSLKAAILVWHIICNVALVQEIIAMKIMDLVMLMKFLPNWSDQLNQLQTPFLSFGVGPSLAFIRDFVFTFPDAPSCLDSLAIYLHAHEFLLLSVDLLCRPSRWNSAEAEWMTWSLRGLGLQLLYKGASPVSYFQEAVNGAANEMEEEEGRGVEIIRTLSKVEMKIQNEMTQEEGKECAICQVDQAPSEGLSVNAGPFFSPTSKPWEGPFLCAECRIKKDAMEGKRPGRPKAVFLRAVCCKSPRTKTSHIERDLAVVSMYLYAL